MHVFGNATDIGHDSSNRDLMNRVIGHDSSNRDLVQAWKTTEQSLVILYCDFLRL